ncbi:putative disease resistance protein RGA4 [Cajanus cajan]|uniref:Disease resistance protein RGA1 n=1 Tax=Cajanus cajan TaxID=3821 RepID=A0A151TU42_CAJCA|nr:putative disease resistance protein RGA4 [Cajanus cajan]KYP70518.1 Putative disease resistance protein RGA1 [Cajanus cajan]
MAEYFVLDIAESLLGKLASSVYGQASRAYDVYEDVQGIKDTLSIVKGVLLDAEEKREQQHGLREWLSQIQNVCLDAEDILDGFQCQNLRKQVVKASGTTRMKVGHFFSSSNSLLLRFKMARQIKYIRHRLDKIAADGNKFGLQRIHADHRLVQRREMTYSYVDASGVIGREKDKEAILKLLMQPHPLGDGDKSLCVIPLVGIGGLGKTTLAKLVFNDKRMDELFKLKIWVCVSDDFDIRQIIIKIINSASASAPNIAFAHQENLNSLDIEQLQSRLRHKLSSQKYLLVLDDIWSDDRTKWIELKDLLKVGAVGNKIIVTTRSNTIASMMGTVTPYVLEGLSMENCLSLFVKWAFKEGEETKYPNLVEIGKEIVKKCRGVPLAVRTLGSSLFLNFNLERWKFVRDHEIWNLKQKKDDILPALKLSYDQMPSYLRLCFAYFSLFPKDFCFSDACVTDLWGAHGLLRSPVGSQKIENISRLYIDELRSRSFLEDFEDLGAHLYCFKVHDLVHDLALYIAKGELVVVNSHTSNIPGQVRHLSVVENDSLSNALFYKSRRVRTILFPIHGVGVDSESLLYTWITRYKYLRVLSLSDSRIETLPNSIGKLEHLRALCLENNRKIKRLPHSICKLQNLKFLSLRGCMELETLPKGLGMLVSLQRLLITTKQSILPEDEFASLNNLHTLSFEYCDNLKFLFRRAQLTSLKVLLVQSCGCLESLPLHILPKLEVLFVIRCMTLNLSLNCESPNHSLRMKLLHLEHCPRQQTLPQWIQGAADTLQRLFILNCDSLEVLPEWLTRMSHLKMLHIFNCPQLLSLPNDMHSLTALEDLSIDGCPELCRKCEPQSGEYWSFISHIKRFSIGETREEKLLFRMRSQLRLRLRN